MSEFSLHWLDYVIFAAMLMVSSSIGLYFALAGDKQRTTKEYLTGDRQLAMLPASISIVVSYMSAISMLGDPAESYMYGAIYMWQIPAGIIGAILASILFVPVFYPLQLTSVNKYYEMRYNSPYPKYLGSASAILMGLTYTGIVIYAPATAIAIILDLPIWLVVIVCACVAIIYTALGGLKAVIWTDVFQAVCMLIGISTILITAVVKVGGWTNSFNLAKEGGRLNFINLSLDPTTRLTVWNTLVASPITYALVFGTTQAAVMRYSGMKDIQTAKNSVYIVLTGNTIIYQIPIMAGLALFSYFSLQRCDPITGGLIESPNQLVIHFLMETLNYPGVPGMFVAALCAGSLSSVSSVLNAASAITWDDLISPRFPNMKEWKATAICKALVFMYGSFAVAISFLTMQLGGTVLQASLSLNNAISVPAFGMVLFGCLCPWINWKGAVAGGITGFICVFWLALGSYSAKKFVTDIIPMNNDMCLINASSLSMEDIWINSSMTLQTMEKHGMEGVLGVMTEVMVGGANATSSGMEESGISDALTWVYSISFMWYALIGLIIFFIVSSLVSLCTGCTKNYDIDPKLLFPCVRKAYARRQQSQRKRNQVADGTQEMKDPFIAEKLMKDSAIRTSDIM